MYVAEGNVDLGITGKDIVEETNLPVDYLMDLGIGKCRMCVQVPISSGIKNVTQLVGKRVVTSFPTITKQYFDTVAKCTKHGTKIKVLHGSVEAACAMGLSDCIVDLVETGETMRACGLEICSTILETSLWLIANQQSQHKEVINYVRRRIDGYITATKFCYLIFNIARAQLAESDKITQGKRSPTVSTLEDSLFVSVSVLVKRSEVQSIMDRLEIAGATDLLVLELANTRAL
jgi:ATP phosphoribosyltransferase